MSRDDDIPDADRAGSGPLPRETHVFFGHAEAEAALLEAYRQGRLPHAWIFGGLEGIGKATLAWRFARFLLVHPDPATAAVQHAQNLEVAPDHPVARRLVSGGHGNILRLRRELNEKTKKLRTEISVDSVRKVIEFFQLSASEGGWRICIVDTAEDLNKSSANALLKLIEEPPSRSVFLIISQKPGQILPTIRSRCRKLMLQPLGEADVSNALAVLAPHIGHPGKAEVQAAIARADGSVREAMRLLDPETTGFDKKLDAALARLPKLDWREVHALADAVTGRAGEEAYDALVRGVFNYIQRRVHGGALDGAPLAVMARMALAWEKLRADIREAEALNLDKRALVIGIFVELAAAAD